MSAQSWGEQCVNEINSLIQDAASMGLGPQTTTDLFGKCRWTRKMINAAIRTLMEDGKVVSRYSRSGMLFHYVVEYP